MSVVLAAHQLTLAYGEKIVAPDMSIAFGKPEIVGIIGPNGSGKSTLLKALSHLIRPVAGQVLLQGENIADLSRRKVAKWMSILPQAATAPGDYAVYDLVACGRAPHRGLFAALSPEDRRVIEEAITMVGLEAFSYRRMDTLSGGEKQRAWLAMALAQQSSILMLDEPTTYLDVHHQLEMMQLIQSLHEDLGLTVIMVLHDLNQAIRFCHRIIAVKNGRIFADGDVETVMTVEKMRQLYGVEMIITQILHEGKKQLVCLPHDVCLPH